MCMYGKRYIEFIRVYVVGLDCRDCSRHSRKMDPSSSRRRELALIARLASLFRELLI